MSVRAISVLLAGACLAGSVACSGSSSGTGSDTKDGGRPDEASHVVKDAGHGDVAQETGREGAAKDASHDDAAKDAGAPDAPPAACVGLDAAAAMIGFPPKCASCIGASCCAQFTTCFNDPGCKAVEICTGNCIEKEGMSPLTCEETCMAANDASTVMSEGLMLNECIVGKCPTPCTP